MSAAQKETAWEFVAPQTVHQITHAEFTSDQKRLANITAQLALAGHQVHKIEAGFLVCRWGMTKVCPDLASLVVLPGRLGQRNEK